MAMLAGPRRKQKVINLRAKNNEWSNDTNKFGQKMLEKMGWSAGKGLGAKENGMVDHVVARYKNDEKGLGFEDKNDQWTKHEDDFNTLLANLSNAEGNQEKLHSGVSLEVKSKKSKARVHYHKFTRGKDLSRYTEKDLANIFGKKTFKNDKPVVDTEKDDIKTTEQVFTEKGSMEDYFKSKLAAFKNKSNVVYQTYEDDQADFSFKGFSGTNEDETTHQGFGFKPFSLDNTETVNENKNVSDLTEGNKLEVCDSNKQSKKEKKKSKEQKKNDADSLKVLFDSPHNNDDNMAEELEENQKKSKKPKKKKQDQDLLETVEASLPIKNKSKKKRKTSMLEENHTIQELDNPTIIEDDVHVPKKKKKRKAKNSENE